MKHTIIILLCFLCGHAYTLQAEDANAQQYQDSILKVAQAMPSTPDKLEYLRDIVYRHQYAPYNKPFSVALFLEVTKRVYFIGNERMLIAHDSNRLRFS